MFCLQNCPAEQYTIFFDVRKTASSDVSVAIDHESVWYSKSRIDLSLSTQICVKPWSLHMQMFVREWIVSWIGRKSSMNSKVHGKPLEIGEGSLASLSSCNGGVTQRNYIDLGVDLIVWYRRSPSKFFGFSTTRIVNVKSFILIASNYARQMFVYL